MEHFRPQVIWRHYEYNFDVQGTMLKLRCCNTALTSLEHEIPASLVTTPGTASQ